VRPSVVEALDTDLDAYLDRELFTRPAVSVSTPGSVFAPAPEPRAEPAPAVPRRTPSLLELAEEESEWLRGLPPPSVTAEAAPVEPPPPVEVAAPPPAYSYSPPAVAPLPAPAEVQAQAPDRSPRLVWVVVGALLGVAVVGSLAAGMLWTGLQIGEAKASRAVSVPVAAVAAAPVVPAVVEAPAPVVAPAPVSPVVVASTVEAAPVQERPAPAPVVQTPRADVVEAPREAPVTPARAIAPAEPREATPPSRPATEPKQGRVRPARVTSASTEARDVLPVSAIVAKAPAPAPQEGKEAEAAPKKASGYEEFDEEYARELGFTDKPAPAPANRRKLQNVYVPPAPGEELPERLTSADIMRVVVSNKASVAGCIQEHRARTEPGAKGQFVARWSVLPDGSTEGATVESAEFRGTPLAQCIEGLVRGWKFPRHRVAQQEPIRFPFTF
jgi:hypothetical protein